MKLALAPSLVVGVALLTLSSVSQAAVLSAPVAESFNYLTTDDPANDTADGDISGNLGGSGWVSPWATNAGATTFNSILNVTSPGLSTGAVSGAGNALSLNGGVTGNALFFRQFSAVTTPANPVNEGSLFLSFLLRRDTDSGRTANLALFNGASEILAIGQFGSSTLNPNGNLAIVYNNNSTPITNTAAPFTLSTGVTNHIVVRIDFDTATGANDRVRLYLNPTGAITDATPSYLDNTTVNLPGFTTLRPFVGGASSGGTFGSVAAGQATFDEISLTAVPEPGTAVLAACGLVGLATRRRR